MKKLLAVLLAVLMLASISVCAFAASSPTQDTSSAPEVTDATAPAADDEAAATAEEVADAEAAEEEAVEAITEVTAETEDEENAEESVIVGLGKLTEDATEEMEADYAALADDLVAAKKDLAANDQAAIPAAIIADAADGATVTASQPFRAVASVYPATITIAVENPADFVGMMAFVNGQWVKVNCIVNEEEGTVTFVLDQPSVLSIVTAIVEAA